MRPRAFTYVAPTTLNEAVELMVIGSDGTMVLAGGQSLVPLMRRRPRGAARPRGISRSQGGQSTLVAARQFLRAYASRSAGQVGAHERVRISPALQGRHFDEPLAVPKGSAPSRGTASDAVHDDGREYREPACRISQRLPVQQGIQPLFRQLADQGHRKIT